MFDDNDGFLAFNYVAVDLRRVNGDHLLHLLLVLFDDLDSTIRSGLYLHTIDLSGDGLNLWLDRLLGGRFMLLVMSVEVVFVLNITLVLGHNIAGDMTYSGPLGESLELSLQLRKDWP